MRGLVVWLFLMLVWLYILVSNGDPSGWEKELEIIQTAPLHFLAAIVTLFILFVGPSCALGWGLTSYFARKNLESEYRGEINTKEETNKHLQLIITERNKTIDDLQTRITGIDRKSIYSQLRPKELQQKTLIHIQELRKFIATKEQNKKDPDINTLSPETTDTGLPLYIEGAEYYKKFHTETIRLRDELRTRLPKEDRDLSETQCKNYRLCTIAYDQPVALVQIKFIANDLERLANNLQT